MTYASNEASVDSSRPYFLYTFTKGATIDRFTSHSEDIVYSGNTYTASPIRHQGIRQSGQLERTTMDVVFPKSSTFAQTFFTPDYSDVQTLTILRSHHGLTNDFETMWKGRVVMYKAERDEIILTCETIQTTMRRSGLRGKWHRNCRHALYSDQCGVDINYFWVNATVDSISGFDVTLTFATADEQADDYFRGGILEKDGEYGYIRKDKSNVITLQYEFDGLQAGDSVRVAPGCNLTIDNCVNKFANVENFGGFPGIPNKNPFGGNGGTRVD